MSGGIRPEPMTRAAYIEKFIARYGELLAINLRGEHVYLVPIKHLVEHGIKKALQDAEAGLFKEVTGTPEADQPIPDQEIVSLVAVIQNSPIAPVGVYKLEDDPLGLTRVSLGGNTAQAVYATYRGTIQDAIKFTEIGLHLLKEQAKKGEAPPPHDPQQN